MRTAKEIAEQVMKGMNRDHPHDEAVLQIVHASGPFRRVVCDNLSPAEVVTLCMAANSPTSKS